MKHAFHFAFRMAQIVASIFARHLERSSGLNLKDFPHGTTCAINVVHVIRGAVSLLVLVHLLSTSSYPDSVPIYAIRTFATVAVRYRYCLRFRDCFAVFAFL
jgi:hypothetical protein